MWQSWAYLYTPAINAVGFGGGSERLRKATLHMHFKLDLQRVTKDKMCSAVCFLMYIQKSRFSSNTNKMTYNIYRFSFFKKDTAQALCSFPKFTAITLFWSFFKQKNWRRHYVGPATPPSDSQLFSFFDLSDYQGNRARFVVDAYLTYLLTYIWTYWIERKKLSLCIGATLYKRLIVLRLFIEGSSINTQIHTHIHTYTHAHIRAHTRPGTPSLAFPLKYA